ncbi:MAG TPA: hypothetical protein VGS98_08615 [Thermoanaerobaculia bacterium]|nr:hypothetical protein [Thermoanaerobaculia bacterium]
MKRSMKENSIESLGKIRQELDGIRSLVRDTASEGWSGSQFGGSQQRLFHGVDARNVTADLLFDEISLQCSGTATDRHDRRKRQPSEETLAKPLHRPGLRLSRDPAIHFRSDGWVTQPDLLHTGAARVTTQLLPIHPA